MNTKRIRTTDFELYSKLNNLKYLNEVVVRNKSSNSLSTILNNVNSNGLVIKAEKINDEYIVLRKVRPLDFSFEYYGNSNL